MEATIIGTTSRVVALVARGEAIYAPSATTTASAANAFLDPASSPYVNELKRSTSSARHKRDVETMKPEYSAVIYKLRPVWYRSKCEGDNQRWGYWGFISEEVAKDDPRLVHCSFLDEDYYVVEKITISTDPQTGCRVGA